MSKIGLIRVVSAEIARNTAMGGASRTGKILLNTDNEKLSRDIVNTVTDYIRKEHWIVMKDYLLENILA